MSSITITSVPKGGEMPAWILEQLVGLDIGLCSPQGVLYIGFKKPDQDIADMNNAFPVSPDSIFTALDEAGKEAAARWVDARFKYRRTTPNGDIILISKDCCRYNP